MIVGKVSRKKGGRVEDRLTSRGKYEKESGLTHESSSAGSLQRATFVRKLNPIFILPVVSFAIYFNSLFGGFVCDDKAQIVANPWIRDIGNIPTIFSKGVWLFQPSQITSNFYRPLMHIVYMFNYHIFGLSPWGFHLVNILFHCGSSVLVFMIMRRFLTEQGITRSPAYLSPPFAAAILFAVHPIHTEAVTWIAALPDVAFTFFYLTSFYCYLLSRDGSKRAYVLSILLFLAATLFKEPAVTLPVMVFAYDFLFKKLDKNIAALIKRYIPYLIVTVIYFFVRFSALKGFAPKESYTYLTTYQYIINIFPLFREYLISLLWPVNLNFWHTFHPIKSLVEAKGIISGAMTVIYFIGMVAAFRRNKIIAWALLLLIIPLFPVFYIKGLSGTPFAERYLYLPSVGYVILLGTFLSWAGEKLPRVAPSVAVVFIILAGAYTVGTVTRNNVWKDDFSLWSETVKKSPDSAVAHNNLGIAYLYKGLLDKAIEQYQTALGLEPGYIEAYFNLGSAYMNRGQSDRAIEEYLTAVRLKPDYAEAHFNLGLIYLGKGSLALAQTEFESVLRIRPGDYWAQQMLNSINSR